MNHYVTASDVTIDNPPADIEQILHPNYWDTDNDRYINSILFYLTNYPAKVTLETDTGLSISFDLGNCINFTSVTVGYLINFAPVSVTVSADGKTAVIEFNKIEEVSLLDVIDSYMPDPQL